MSSPTAASGAAPLRTLVVGTGGMGMSWLRAVQRHPDLELAGVADVDERRAKGAVVRLRRPETPVAASLDGLDGVAADVCINVTPPDAHASVIEQALARGLAVLTEKPFTDRLADATRLTRTARERGVLLMVAQTRSYEPGLLALRDAVRAFDAVATVTVELAVAYPAAGFRAEMAQPLLLDMGVHAFDAVRRVTGARPVAAYCDAFQPPGSGYLGPAAAAGVFELDDGIRFTYTGSWCAGGTPTSWNGRWRVTGSDRAAEWDGGTATVDPVDQVRPALDDFVRALRTGATPWGECADNLFTLAMADAAVESVRTGARVRVEDVAVGGS